MKKILAIITSFLLSAFSPALFAQWTATYSISSSDVVYCLVQSTVIVNSVTTKYQYAGTSSGVYISTNYGTKWTLKDDGLSESDPSILSIAPRGSNVFSGGYGGLYRSTNYGAIWSSTGDYNNGITVPSITSIVINGQNILASTISSGVYRSTNSGTSWTAVNDGFPDVIPWIYSMLLTSVDGTTKIYAATGSGVYVTPTNGNTWYLLNDGLPTYNIVYSLVNYGNVILAGTSAGLYKSTNLGSTWYAVSSAPVYTFYSFALYGTYIFGGTSAGVYMSSDYGTNWTEVSDGIEYEYITALGVMDSYILAGTYDNGIWRRPVSEMIPSSTGTGKNEVPTDFAVMQNYPNPFNPVTTIKFSSALAGRVSIKIFNALGQEIDNPVNEFKPAGNYSVAWNGSRHPSGVYFYQFEVTPSGVEKAFREIKKMLLIK